MSKLKLKKWTEWTDQIKWELSKETLRLDRAMGLPNHQTKLRVQNAWGVRISSTLRLTGWLSVEKLKIKLTAGAKQAEAESPTMFILFHLFHLFQNSVFSAIKKNQKKRDTDTLM